MEYNYLLLILGICIVTVSVFGFVFECSKDLKKYQSKTYRNLNKKSKPKVPYTKLINEIVEWTGPQLLNKNIKYYPKIKLTYRNHRKVHGRYHTSNKTIEVFVYPNVNSVELVKTTLHEIRHYVQHQTDSNFKNYDRISAKMGYENNPFELDSRSYAKSNLKNCLNHLRSNNLL